jgi:quinol-cytochrome oxidoreductase complex cytochrome b subunit
MFLKKKDTTEKKDPKKTYDILSELAMIAGFLLFVFGIYLIYPPAACVIGGAGLFALGFPASKFTERRRK